MKAAALGALFSLLPYLPAPIHVLAPSAHVDLHTRKVAAIVGMINSESVARFETEYALTEKLPGDRVILIDSPGGVVDDGQKMIDIMEAERHRGIRQICVVLYNAHSMAFNFFTHCDVRLSLSKAKMLIHKVATSGVDCMTQRCTAEMFKQLARDLKQTDAPYRKANAKALKMLLDDYDLFADQEHMFTAEALLKRGYLAGIAFVELE